MIIVEGFDAAGKSTLAAKIGSALGWEVLHPGGPTKDEQDVYNCLLRSLARMRQRCVQDRVTHISEAAYSMLTYPEKSATALNAIREVAAAELIIYCRPPTEVLLEGLRNHRLKEHDDFLEIEKVMNNAPMIIRTYDTLMHLVASYVGVRLLKHDFTDPASETHILQIIERKFK